MTFPDSLDKPLGPLLQQKGITFRFKHVIKDENRYRRLTQQNLKMNMFPINHTRYGINGIITNSKGPFMGNALVVGVVEKIGISLVKLATNNNHLLNIF